MHSAHETENLAFRRSNTSVESFITERYVKVWNLDLNVTQAQFCNCVVSLLLIEYQFHFATARINWLTDLLEAVRKLEFIYEVNESRRSTCVNVWLPLVLG